jgi:hypothetical protein
MRLLACALLLSSPAWAAPPGARIEGEAIVITQDGKEARLQQHGMTYGTLARVPLKADGSEPAIWATVSTSLGATGLIIRFAEPPAVIFSVAQYQSNPGIESAMRKVWLLDVDGDGWNDAITYTTRHSDVGSQDDSPSVQRFDPASGRFVAGGKALDKRAPRQWPGGSRKLERLIPSVVHRAETQRHGELDGRSERLPAPPRPEVAGIIDGTPPWVGPDLIQLVRAKVPGKKLGGEYHLVHARMAPTPAVVSSMKLGDLGFPMDACAGDRGESFGQKGAEIVIVWPLTMSSLVEQRVPWDGKKLGKPAAPPHEVARCGL